MRFRSILVAAAWPIAFSATIPATALAQATNSFAPVRSPSETDVVGGPFEGATVDWGKPHPVVTRIRPDSPAARVLEVGDILLEITVDGRSITSQERLEKLPPNGGDLWRAQVNRRGRILEGSFQSPKNFLERVSGKCFINTGDGKTFNRFCFEKISTSYTITSLIAGATTVADVRVHGPAATMASTYGTFNFRLTEDEMTTDEWCLPARDGTLTYKLTSSNDIEVTTTCPSLKHHSTGMLYNDERANSRQLAIAEYKALMQALDEGNQRDLCIMFRDSGLYTAMDKHNCVRFGMNEGVGAIEAEDRALAEQSAAIWTGVAQHIAVLQQQSQGGGTSGSYRNNSAAGTGTSPTSGSGDDGWNVRVYTVSGSNAAGGTRCTIYGINHNSNQPYLAPQRYGIISAFLNSFEADLSRHLDSAETPRRQLAQDAMQRAQAVQAACQQSAASAGRGDGPEIQVP